MDGRLREVEGRVGRAGVREGGLESFVCGEEGARAGDGHEDYGADSLVETTEEGRVKVSVLREKRGGSERR